MIHSFVLPDGTLDEHRVLKKELVYQGINGRFVERFFINSTHSYIFKPMINDNQFGKELWVHNHVLKKLPSFYPKLIAYSIERDCQWIIFEDLGVINHHFSEESVLGVTKLLAEWHKTPGDMFNDIPQKGPKPFIQEVVKHLEIRKDDVRKLASKHHIPASTIKSVYIQLNNISFDHKEVFSHGDLHLGNFGYAKGKLVIIDWEHAHLNSPYWDLYHLLDISHPDFPKRISKNLRNAALNLYMDEFGHLREPAIRKIFKKDYFLFSSAFSLWMLLLIEADLKKNEAKWSKDQLKQQLEETISSLKQCIDELRSRSVI